MFNQFEKDWLVIKLRKAREAKRQKTGRCEGCKPFGQDREHAKRENAVVNLLKQLQREPIDGERLSFAAITTKLNACAEQDPTLRPRGASKWHLAQVKRILTQA